jgi:hypothetical protein
VSALTPMMMLDWARSGLGLNRNFLEYASNGAAGPRSCRRWKKPRWWLWVLGHACQRWKLCGLSVVRVAGGSWHSHYDDKVMWWRCEQHGWLHALIQPKVSPIFGCANGYGDRGCCPLLGGVMEVRWHLPCSHLSLVAKTFFENIMEIFTPHTLHPKDAHSHFY